MKEREQLSCYRCPYYSEGEGLNCKLEKMKDFGERETALTIEEALTQLRCIRDGYRGAYHSEAIMFAIEALKKQVPKKPIMCSTIYAGGEIETDSYRCPVCKELYKFDYDGKLKYCNECGQAINWSEEE